MDKHYKTRGEAGEEQIYSSPAALLAKAYEYFEWCEQFPCTRQELMKSGDKKGDIIDIPLGRPFTIVGLCVYCGISEATLDAYGAAELYSDVVTHIRNVVSQEQIEGATLGVYNASIISRLQGLSDKQELSTLNGKPLTIRVSLQETKDELKKLKEKLNEE